MADLKKLASGALKAAQKTIKKTKAKAKAAKPAAKKAAKAKKVAPKKKATKALLPKGTAKTIIVNIKVNSAQKKELQARAVRFTKGNLTALLHKGALAYKGPTVKSPSLAKTVSK